MLGDPADAKSITDTDTHLFSDIGDTMSPLSIWSTIEEFMKGVTHLITHLINNNVFVEQPLAKPVGLLTNLIYFFI